MSGDPELSGGLHKDKLTPTKKTKQITIQHILFKTKEEGDDGSLCVTPLLQGKEAMNGTIERGRDFGQLHN